jgi:sec-independent protein translocase protein TatB
MLDISIGEIILVLLIAMIFLGPDRIPKVARQIGEFFRMVRDAFFQVKDDITKDEETAKVFNEMQNTVTDIANAVNIKKLVREMGTPLMEPVKTDNSSDETEDASYEKSDTDSELNKDEKEDINSELIKNSDDNKSDSTESTQDNQTKEVEETSPVTEGLIIDSPSPQTSRSYKIDRKFKRVDSE